MKSEKEVMGKERKKDGREVGGGGGIEVEGRLLGG